MLNKPEESSQTVRRVIEVVRSLAHEQLEKERDIQNTLPIDSFRNQTPTDSEPNTRSTGSILNSPQSEGPPMIPNIEEDYSDSQSDFHDSVSQYPESPTMHRLRSTRTPSSRSWSLSYLWEIRDDGAMSRVVWRRPRVTPASEGTPEDPRQPTGTEDPRRTVHDVEGSRYHGSSQSGESVRASGSSSDSFN